MKVDLTNIKQEIVKMYLEGVSSYRIADHFKVSATAVKRTLKEERVLRTQAQAASQRDNAYLFGREQSEEKKRKISEHAKLRVGELNPFFGKTHTEEVKNKLSEKAKTRQGKLNPNYKHGKNLRRPRDFKQAEFTKIRNAVFNRDNHTCKFSGIRGGHLHAHHLLPYWVCTEAFLDIDNLITVSRDEHFSNCHKQNWQSFNVEIIPDSLLEKYNLCRERLNELAATFRK